MALIHCDFSSNVLGLDMAMCVILPESTPPQGEFIRTPDQRKHPTLYLLHGLSDDHTAWQRRTSLERYVASLDLAVVMPAVHRSFYTDMAHGHPYWTFISEELPALAQSFFPLSDMREDNFVAGLSMGGYGAFKLAVSHPERYGAAASLSGALDMVRLASEDKTRQMELQNIFGDLRTLPGSGNDLFYLAEQMAQHEKIWPRLYQWCGTDDFLYADNLRFSEHAQALGLDLTYEDGPGAHEWACWDQQIQRVLAWLPLRH